MWLLFIPVVLVVVLALMVLGTLFAGVFWILGMTWPWLLIGLGAWMFWHHDGPHNRRARALRRHEHGHGQHPARSETRPTREPLLAATSRPAADRQTELPIDLQVKVEQIRRKVDVLLGYADRFPPFSQDLFLVRQTATDYLPRTIEAFLAMPKQSTDKPMATDGKTARQELKGQLDLLDSKLDEIAQDLQRQDADRLLANRRFLESRFGLRDEKPFAVKNGAA
jgi:ABC-type nickel/cobalt efflux system permease component RcnA